MKSRCGLSALRFLVSLTVSVPVLLNVVGMAQQPTAPQVNSQTNEAPAAKAENTVTIPAGTRLQLVLTHSIDSKSTHKGDEVDTQITAPVTVGNQAAIPAGTYVQGKVEKLSRKGNRGEFLMQSTSVILPDGYVVSVPSPVNIESDEGTAWRNPSGAATAGAIASPLGGAGIGALIGHAAHTTQSTTLGGTTLTSNSVKGVAIGTVIGAAAGGVVALVLLARSHQFYVEVGSPMDLTLPKPVTLASNQVADAMHAAQTQPAAITPAAKRPVPQFSTNTGTCYTPGIPGTPPTVIPGTPATPDSPGTPDVLIPGTPPTPGTAYPCP
jgi:hypothetical protein